MNWAAVDTTVRLAGVTMSILLVLGTPLAYWLAFTRWRWKFLAEAVVALPLVLPPTVLGYYLLVAMGPRGVVGQAHEALFDSRLPFTFRGLVVASILYSLPFAVQPLLVAFQAVDRRLIEASWTLGVSKTMTFFRVILPLSLGGLLTAAVLSFAHTIGEFGVVLMVGGNIEGATRTISIDIYDDVQSLHYPAAGRTSFVLLVGSFVVLAIVYSVNRTVWKVWPDVGTPVRRRQ